MRRRLTTGRRHGQRAVVLLLCAALALAACGTGDGDDVATSDEASRDARDTLAATGLEEDDAGEAGDGDVGAAGATSTRPAVAPEAPAAAGGSTGAASGSGAFEATGDDAGADRASPEQQEVGLRAGSVDDNEDFEAYLAYRAEFARLRIAHDRLPVEGRRMILVEDADGRPVHDARIEVSDGTVLRTGTDGRAVYLGPVPDGQQQQPELTATVSKQGRTAEFTFGDDGTETVTLNVTGVDDVRLDLLFLVDATGSMSDEIDRLKATMVEVAERIDALPGEPDVRFGLTSYRDVGDAYVARTVDFTADVGRFVGSLRDLRAAGGGDHPEAFNEAFAEAVSAPAWRTDEDVVRLVVLVADAPPHVGRGTSYVDTIGDAAALGVRVFPIASSGTDDQAEYIFRQVAQATLGRFVFLSYGAGGAAVGEHSDVDDRDYDVLALDDLVVRLVEEQLAPLAGDGEQ